MKLKTKLMMAASALLVSATMAYGAITSDQLAAQYQADGYSYITIKTGVTQIKVEAVKNGTRYEVVYDIETGAAIDTSTHAIGPITTPDPGVIVRAVSRDFEDSRGGGKAEDDDLPGAGVGSDDGPGHDLTDDHGADDDSDHAGGKDDDSDQSGGVEDDSDDDHGGNSGGRSGRDDHDDDHGDEDHDDSHD